MTFVSGHEHYTRCFSLRTYRSAETGKKEARWKQWEKEKKEESYKANREETCSIPLCRPYFYLKFSFNFF